MSYASYDILSFYVLNSIGYNGPIIKYQTFCVVNNLDGSSFINNWNGDLLGPKPQWSDVQSFWDSQDHLEPGTYPIEVSGDFQEALTVMIDFSINNDVITINVPSFGATFSDTGSTFTSKNSIPENVRPKYDITSLKTGVMNKVSCLVIFVIQADGYIVIYSDIKKVVFTGYCSIDATTITYKI